MPPPNPPNFTLTQFPAGSDNVKIQWENYTSATNGGLDVYFLSVSWYNNTGTSGQEDIYLEGLTEPSYTISNLGYQELTFRIIAFDIEQNQSDPAIKNINITETVTSLPSSPTDLSGTPGNQTVQVSFTAGNNGGSAITNYMYSLNGGAFTAFSPAQTTSPVTISGLANGTQYNIQLKAVNTNGASTASGTVTVTPQTTPSSPTGLSATAGNQTVQVSFTAGNNGGSAITNYMYSTDGGSTFTAFSPAQTTSPVTISGLANGTQYSIQLKALNTNGSSTASGTVTATPIAPSGGGGSGSGGGGIPCIPAGQRILTPTGYKLIETLKQDDLIQTSDGRSVPVRLYSTTIEKTTEETAPVRIGATLLLSPMHAFKVNKRGWMIPKLAVLKNLYDVKQEPLGQTVTYYHVETTNYLRDNLVVEGTVVEGYGKTFAKAHNLSFKDIYRRSKDGPWLERITSIPPPNSKAKN